MSTDFAAQPVPPVASKTHKNLWVFLAGLAVVAGLAAVAVVTSNGILQDNIDAAIRQVQALSGH